jgi:DNA-binding response OmpR family regulator
MFRPSSSDPTLIVRKANLLKIENAFRVLVVEDEVMISMLIEDMLADMGCKCVDVAPSVEVALEALAKDKPDFAMLDINLNGKRSFPVADALKNQAIPFVFLSGYGSPGLSGEYADAKVLQKPFRLGDLEVALGDFLNGLNRAARIDN